MLALVSDQFSRATDPRAKKVSRELRLVADNIQKKRESETRRDFESSRDWERLQWLEAQRRLANCLLDSVKLLESVLNIGNSISLEEYRALKIKMKAAIMIFKVHGML